MWPTADWSIFALFQKVLSVSDSLLENSPQCHLGDSSLSIIMKNVVRATNQIQCNVLLHKLPLVSGAVWGVQSRCCFWRSTKHSTLASQLTDMKTQILKTTESSGIISGKLTDESVSTPQPSTWVVIVVSINHDWSEAQRIESSHHHSKPENNKLTDAGRVQTSLILSAHLLTCCDL